MFLHFMRVEARFTVLGEWYLHRQSKKSVSRVLG